MHMMTQTLEGGDGPCFPHGLSVMNTYTEMTTRNNHIVVLKNLTATLITIAKGVNVSQVVALNAVLQVEVVLGTMEKLDEFRVSGKVGCQLSRGGRHSSSNWSYLAWGSGLTKT